VVCFGGHARRLFSQGADVATSVATYEPFSRAPRRQPVAATRSRRVGFGSPTGPPMQNARGCAPCRHPNARPLLLRPGRSPCIHRRTWCSAPCLHDGGGASDRPFASTAWLVTRITARCRAVRWVDRHAGDSRGVRAVALARRDTRLRTIRRIFDRELIP
jgi:hypothetical protein